MLGRRRDTVIPGLRATAPQMSGSLAGRPAQQKSEGAGPPGTGLGAPLTHPVLDLGGKPVGGPLVELRGAHAGCSDGWTDGKAGAAGDSQVRAPPPPLIGPRRTCPYKAGMRRIPAAADFLNPVSRPDPGP